MNERPTPETDANVGEWDEGKFWDHPKGRIVEADFARKLERERDEALETVRQYSRQIEKVKDEARESKDRISKRAEAIRCELVRAERERDELRQELDELKAGAVHSCHDQCQRPGCVRRRENEAMREVIRETRDFICRLRPSLLGLPYDDYVVRYGVSQDYAASEEAINETLAKLKPFTTP
jgi:hypothetical protein